MAKKVCKCGEEILTKAKQCSPCAKEYMSIWRKKKLEEGAPRHDVYNYRWRSKNPRKYILQNARGSAKQRGLYFDLKEEDIIIPNKCPVFGMTLELVWGEGVKDNKPSLDRIDSSKGYTKDNIQVISWRANNLKKDATPNEIMKLARFMCNA